MDADSLYQQVILDHFRNPRNRRPVLAAERSSEGCNPACGDRLRLAASLDAQGRLDDLHFEASGCALSVASASLLSEACRGLTAEQVEALTARVEAALRDTSPPDLPGDLAALAGVRRFPLRHKCALLPWRAVSAWLAQNAGSTGGPG